MEEIVGQHSYKQAGLVGCESAATGLVPAQRVLPLFDAVLNIAASIVHFDHLPGRQLGMGHDEPDPREEFSFVPLDLGNHSAVFVPLLCLIPEINQPDLNSALGRSPHRTRQVRVDESVQHRIGRKPDEVRDSFDLAILVHARVGKGCVTPKPEQDESGPIPLHNRIEEVEDSVGLMNVTGPQLGPQAVAVVGESEQRMKAVLPEMTVKRHVLLLTVRRVFR